MEGVGNEDILRGKKVEEFISLAAEIGEEDYENVEFGEEELEDEELIKELGDILNAKDSAEHLQDVAERLERDLKLADEISEETIKVDAADENMILPEGQGFNEINTTREAMALQGDYENESCSNKEKKNSNGEEKLNSESMMQVSRVESDSEARVEREGGMEDARDRNARIYQILHDLMRKQAHEAYREYMMYKERQKFKEARDSFRVYEGYERDLKLIELARNTLDCHLPLYRIENFERTVEIVNESLSLYEMEIRILRLTDVRVFVAKNSPCDLYVACEIPYPDVKNPIKFVTQTKKGLNNFEYNFVKAIKILRNRGLSRLGKRKVSFLVVKKGWFFTQKVIGRAELKLNQLEDHIDLNESLYVFGDGKCTVGRLEVVLRLRIPLVKRQCERVLEKKLVIDKHFVYEEKNSDYDKKSENNGVQETATVDARRDYSEKQVAEEGGSLFYDVDIDWIVSNAVLEEIANELNRYMETCRDEDRKAMLRARGEQVQSKMTILVVMVQTGKLTPESYTELLKKKIEEERVYAKSLLELGKKGQALNCIKRIKIMEKEMNPN